MKPKNLAAKIFLDSGDPKETRQLIGLLGFLDGQTTNPTLLSKNPEAKKRLEGGGTFSSEEILGFYKDVVKEVSSLISSGARNKVLLRLESEEVLISSGARNKVLLRLESEEVLIPQGSVSVEVYADKNSKSEAMLAQGREMFSWIPGAHIKFPTTAEGLKAAKQAIKEGMRINMTLCFSQEQAAAVYAATKGAKRGDVFVSPFVGRLDDGGENGMSLIGNILRMYQKGDGHVMVLTASVRTMDHFLYALKLKSDIITAPFAILKEWGEKGMPLPGENFSYDAKSLNPISYKEIDLEKDWTAYAISHELTDKGMERFSQDWNALIG